MSYEAIASAFGRGLALHAPTVERMREHYAAQGKELNAARLRMATLPEGCVVHTTPGAWVPLAQVHNVFILPGVPVRHAAAHARGSVLRAGCGCLHPCRD